MHFLLYIVTYCVKKSVTQPKATEKLKIFGFSVK